MKLILTSDVPGLGAPGEVVEVRDGYGRNFLLPQGKAIAATKGAEAATKAAAASHTTFDQFLINVFPDNFIGAFARGELLQVLVIALIFGFGLMVLSP